MKNGPLIFFINSNESHHSKSRKDGERFQCPSCDSNYSRKDHLNAHIKKFHNNETATTDIKGTVAQYGFTRNGGIYF